MDWAEISRRGLQGSGRFSYCIELQHLHIAMIESKAMVNEDGIGSRPNVQVADVSCIS